MGENISMPLVSVVIPVRNKEGNIARLHADLLAAVAGLPYDFEFIVIDNASEDQTGVLIKAICARDPR